MGCNFYIIKHLRITTSCDIKVSIQFEKEAVYCGDTNIDTSKLSDSDIEDVYYDYYVNYAEKWCNFTPELYLYKDNQWKTLMNSYDGLIDEICYGVRNNSYSYPVDICDWTYYSKGYRNIYQDSDDSDSEDDLDIKEHIILDMSSSEEDSIDSQHRKILKKIFIKAIEKEFSYYKENYDKFFYKCVNVLYKCNKDEKSYLSYLPLDIIKLIINDYLDSDFRLTIQDISITEYVQER
jgi:hypothetical protein